jgi:hypothetical protein
MGEWITYTEPYWTVCWAWIFPYPCKKYHEVRRWCITFDWVKENRWFFFCTLEGCAGGRRYNWTAFCFGLFGSATFFGIRRCFSQELQPSGTCG